MSTRVHPKRGRALLYAVPLMVFRQRSTDFFYFIDGCTTTEGFMHPLTRLFHYLKRNHFSVAVEREHLSEREQVEWYPVWMYELMETDENRNQPYRDTIREVVAGKVVLELGTGRKALWAVCCALAGARKVYAVEANKRAYQQSLTFLRSRNIDNVHLIYGFSDRITL